MIDRDFEAKEDVVLEIKIRLSGLTYDEARDVRDSLRDPEEWAMLAIIEDVIDLTKEIAPQASVRVFSPWAEWRPAVGKRQKEIRNVSQQSDTGGETG